MQKPALSPNPEHLLFQSGVGCYSHTFFMLLHVEQQNGLLVRIFLRLTAVPGLPDIFKDVGKKLFEIVFRLEM